jgi:hypothetical protein
MQYCNVEGVSFLSGERDSAADSVLRLAFVSDQAKKDAPAICDTKGQSVHIFDVPPPASK